jgi:hypothetical protein
MRRMGIVIGVVIAVVAGLVSSALAGDNGAQKADFFSLALAQGCDLVQPGVGTPDRSSAVVNRNPAGNQVTAQVQLRDALPNTTYNIAVWVNNCSEGDFFQVRTNNQGNENRQVRAIVTRGPTINDVILSASASGGSRFQANPESDVRALAPLPGVQPTHSRRGCRPAGDGGRLAAATQSGVASIPIRLIVSESLWPAASVTVNTTFVKSGPRKAAPYVCTSAPGGSVAQPPPVEDPSPKSIDQLVRSPSGSVLLKPRKR